VQQTADLSRFAGQAIAVPWGNEETSLATSLLIDDTTPEAW
jgi:hypothetical protein